MESGPEKCQPLASTLEKIEGGITDIECRVFRNLALRAGAREVDVHVDDELATYHFSLSNLREPVIAEHNDESSKTEIEQELKCTQ